MNFYKFLLPFSNLHLLPYLGLKVDIQGQTDMPFWKHDLKLEAIKELLETIDKKDFYEANKHEKFQKHMEEVQELLNAIWE